MKLGPCNHPTSRTFHRGKATVVLCHQCSYIKGTGPGADLLVADYRRGNDYKTVTVLSG